MHQQNDGRRSLSLLTVALLASLGGCIAPGSVVCSDGRTCPSGTRCDDQLELCVSDAQMLACNGLRPDDDCKVANAPGRCRGGVCEIFYCGDDKRVGAEECDGTDVNHKTCTDLGFYKETTGLKCKADCTFDFTGCADNCGDGKINAATELCDGADLGGADCRTAGFYEAAGLSCTSYCRLDVSACKGSCGDGIINGPEQCDGKPPAGKTCFDYGFDRGALGCSSLCGPQLEGCAQTGWRSVLSTDYPVIAVWGSGPNDVFAVGKAGTIIRGSGTTWTRMKSDTTADLWGVWGSGPDHVFAVGGGGLAAAGNRAGVILLWDGMTWKDVAPTKTDMDAETPPLGLYTSVWGSGPNDVFVVDRYAHAVVHWDGKSWTQLPPLPATQGYTEILWGSGPKDVYAIGDGIVRWDGTTWTQAWDPPDFVALQGIWGSGPSDVFAIDSNFILHWDGTRWLKATLDSSVALAGIWGTGPKDAFVVGFTGGEAADARAQVIHWNGTSWSVVASLDEIRRVRFTAGVWGSSAEDIYIAGVGNLRHSSGDSWFATPSSITVDSLWAAGPHDLFALGNTLFAPSPMCPPDCPPAHFTVERFTGLGSSKADVLSPELTIGLHGDTGQLWGSSANDLFAAFEGEIEHWDGKAWSPSYTPGPQGSGGIYPHDLWGNGPNNVVAVGATGVEPGTGACSGIVRWNGSQWAAMPLSITAFCLNAVWVSSQGEVFAVGERGSIVHWDGTTWSVMTSGTGEDLSSVWGSGPGDVFAVGTAGTILRFDGAAWSTMSSGTTANLQSVRGSGAADVFVLGDELLLHLRGGHWETLALPPRFSAQALSVTPSRVFLAGPDPAAGPNVPLDQILHLDRSGVTCAGPEKNCGDGWDNDCDGLADGADPDCGGKVAEQCANLVDDDGNGKIDCQDAGCATFPSCRGK